MAFAQWLMDSKTPAPASKPNNAAKPNTAARPNGPADPAGAATPEPAKRRVGKKLVVLSTLGLLLAGGSAGGAWYVTQQRKPDGAAAQHQKQAAARPLFSTLDPFTVNLQDPYSERVAQIGVTLQFEDPALEVRIKDRLPAVRNSILLLISSKRVDELITTEGKEQLAQQIRFQSARALGLEVRDPAAAPAAGAKAAAAGGPDNPISAVLFSQFLVQ